MYKYILVASFLILLPACWMSGGFTKMHEIKSIQNVVNLFPQNVHEIETRVSNVKDNVGRAIDALIAVPDNSRTFANTLKAYDDASNLITREISSISSLLYVSPREEIRNAAQMAVVDVDEFIVDHLVQNQKLYKAIKSYADTNAEKEVLNDEEKYFLKEVVRDFERNGLNLSPEELDHVSRIKKELTVLETDFDKAINDSKNTIAVTKDELEGVSPEFVESLSKNEDKKYILGTDYPTVHEVLENCLVESTRKSLWQAFNSRAYPENEVTLKKIIAKRDELAHILGFSSYAAYDIDDSMAQTPEVVEAFLEKMADRSTSKALEEIARYKNHLPKGVTLTDKETIKPWDWAFIRTTYKKDFYNLDNRVVAEYFPVKETLEGLLKIYEQFLNIRFTKLHDVKPWGIEVSAIQVNKIDGTLLGYLLLDLYPRPFKYSHACHITLAKALKDKEGKLTTGASLVIANFPKSSGDRPALLTHSDVVTFFHEFGHAMHSLLGSTEMASYSGTSVKRDFVELPSQMLEEWIWDPEIVHGLSKHYQTGEPLPKELLDTMIKLKNLDSGDGVKRQIALALISLNMFKEGGDKEPNEISKKYGAALRPYMAQQKDDHFECSFGHLTGYASKYYGYLWSKVFALDMFDAIKSVGLLNPEAGERYVNLVIGKGGSRPPQDLLKDFLGREPNTEAFFKDLGF